MDIAGRIHHGVVVMEGGISLPEGTEVVVSCRRTPGVEPGKGKRVEFPLVHGEFPGSVNLTNERIAEILEEEDGSP